MNIDIFKNNKRNIKIVFDSKKLQITFTLNYKVIGKNKLFSIGMKNNIIRVST